MGQYAPTTGSFTMLSFESGEGVMWTMKWIPILLRGHAKTPLNWNLKTLLKAIYLVLK